MLRPFLPLRPYLARYKARFTTGFLCLLVSQLVGVIVPLIIKAGIDDLMHGGTARKLLGVAGLLLAVGVTKAVLQFWMRWILIGISRDVEYDLRNDLFAHLMRLSPRYYTENRTGDLMSKLTNDLNAVRNMVGPGIMYSANTVVVGAATIALMLHLDWRLTLYSLIPMPLVSIGVKFLGQMIHERFEKIQALYSDLTERVRENLSGVRVVRAFCQEESEMKEFDGKNLDFLEKNKSLILVTSFLWPGLALLFAAAFLLVMVVGGQHVLQGKISVGTFAAFNVYLTYLFWPMVALGWVTNIVQRGLASLGRLMTIFESKADIDDRAVPAHPLTSLRGEIEFRNLTFSYNGTPVLKNLNLQIPAGKTLAIVGATGSGKSTLVGLIPRLYDAPEGSLLMDGVPIRQIPLHTLREHIGYVPQETFLFSETIRENIKFGAPEASTPRSSTRRRFPTSCRKFRVSPRALTPWWASAGLRFPGGRNNARRFRARSSAIRAS